MSKPNFEDLVYCYFTNAYTKTVEDFLSAFELHYTYDELFWALVDAFRKRGLEETAIRLEGAAQVVPIKRSDEKE